MRFPQHEENYPLEHRKRLESFSLRLATNSYDLATVKNNGNKTHREVRGGVISGGYLGYGESNRREGMEVAPRYFNLRAL